MSPATYQSATQVGAAATVDARAALFDARGRPVGGSPTWTPSRPDMVTVSPARARDVRITVQRPGDSSITVGHEGASQTLSIKATLQGTRWSVEITTHEAGSPARRQVASRTDAGKETR